MTVSQLFAGLSIRKKLLALVLLPLLVVLPLLGMGLLIWGNEALDRLLIRGEAHVSVRFLYRLTACRKRRLGAGGFSSASTKAA